MASQAQLPACDFSGPSRRQSERFRVLLMARLVTLGNELGVKIRNLSMSGLLVEGPNLPAPGSGLLLRRGAMEAFTTIVWRSESLAGLEFEEPLSKEEVWSQINARPAPAVIDHALYRRPGLRGNQLTKKEWAELEAWKGRHEDGPA